MTTTPPLRSAVQTPSTPRHGAKYDITHSYPTRKTTRSSTQPFGRAAQTPPPPPVVLSASSPKSSNRSTTRSSNLTFSPPSSTQTSPKKTLFKVTKASNRQTGSSVLHPESTASAAKSRSRSSILSEDPASVISAAAMLPTPAKTPRKRQPVPGVSTTARVLFPTRPDTVEEAMPSTRKKARNGRHIGFSLGSFMEDEENASEGHIEIYTDSKDKVPELDKSEDNPFYVKPGQASSLERPAPRASKRRKVGNDLDDSKEMEQAFKREDGMVYVFRGKKIFRKFDDDREDEETQVNLFDSDEWHDSEIDGESSPPLRPFTRSSIKPRLLFPTEEQRRAREAQAEIADEEAITDIEEHHLLDSEMTDLAGDTEEEVVVTPVKPTFIPASPPTSGRTTRAASRKAALDSSPLAPEPVELPSSVAQNVKKRSPFDMWRRTKVGAGGAGRGKKREGDVLERNGRAQAKKAKSNGV